MGGYGSGGWNASGRPTTEDLLRIDVNRWNRQGRLRDGAWWVLHWRQGGNEYLAEARCRRDVIEIRQILPVSGQVDAMMVIWEACRFGGRRPFFICPGCGDHVLHLYRYGSFQCRKCHALTYASQRERESDRAQRRAGKIRRRLGGKAGWENFVPRPKGMHARTYERLTDRIGEADAITTEYARKRFGLRRGHG